jgi:sec-independent protein translocase protein TatA
MHQLLAFGAPGPFEWIIIAGLGLLIFGKRLPEVGRSLGKGIVEFKKGLKGVEDEISTADEPATPSRTALPSQTQPQIAPQPAVAAKFDPYTGKPVQPEFDPYTGKRTTPENTVPAGGTVEEHSEPVSHQ